MTGVLIKEEIWRRLWQREDDVKNHRERMERGLARLLLIAPEETNPANSMILV